MLKASYDGFTGAELKEIGFDVPQNYNRHCWLWSLGLEVTECVHCGTREAYRDDIENPVNQCMAREDLRYYGIDPLQGVVRPNMVEWYFASLEDINA